jgi:hypothetical protein
LPDFFSSGAERILFSDRSAELTVGGQVKLLLSKGMSRCVGYVAKGGFAEKETPAKLGGKSMPSKNPPAVFLGI